MQQIILLLAVGVLAGVLGSILGIGGGIIVTPVLTLAIGLDIKYAIGASIIAVIATSSGAAISYLKDDMINVTDETGDVFEIGELSKGTMEQLYISIRFAFMQAFADTVRLPIIIDDAFVAFDDVRLRQAFSLLNKIAEQTQVIYFSAKKEVYDLIDDQKIINLNEK